MKQAIVGKVIRCLFSLLVTAVDHGSDILLTAEYFRRGDLYWARMTMAFPLISNIFQCLITITDRDRPIIVLCALLGFKPFIDTWRAITGAPQGTRKFSPAMCIAMNRGTELVFESIPQTCFQTFRILASMATDEVVSSIQIGSVIASFLAVGFIFTICDYEVDTSERFRRIEPEIYGFVPSPKGKRVVFGILSLLHMTSYAAMRVIAAALLVYVQPVIFAAWIATLFGVFTSAKLLRGSFTYFNRISHAMSHFVNVATFFAICVGAPFTFRIPYLVSGRLYTCFLLYGYIDAFLMLYVSKALASSHLQFDNTMFNLVLKVMASCACASAVSLWILKNKIMEKSFNWMWWSNRTPSEHFSEYIWNNFVYTEWGPSIDDSRAYAISIVFCQKYYIHDIRVKEWLYSHWDEWTNDPPSWFDDVFKRSIPHEFIPEGHAPAKRDNVMSRISATFKVRSRRSELVVVPEGEES